MKRNIEIKAKLHDWSRAEQTARSLSGNAQPLQLSQIDTYFHVQSGRLKLWEISGMENRAELIHYQRSNLSGPKKSDYRVCPAEDASALKDVLSQALGVRTVVMKRRSVYLFHNVRIHLDRVESLGAFLEFEAVLSDSDDEAQGVEIINDLLARFGLAQEDLVKGSYGDMMESRENPPH